MASSNFPNRPFRLEEGVWVYGQNAWNTGNNTLIHSELWIHKNSYSPTWSASGSSYQMFVAGIMVGSNGNFGFDFRNSDSLLLHASNNWINNDANGNLWVSSDGYANVSQLGYTEVHGGIPVPRIPRPPSAPYLDNLTHKTTTSFRLYLVGANDNGAAIDSWDFQLADNAAMTTNVFTRNNAGRIHDITGLVPGKSYYIRGRAHNSAGWGDWGPVNGPQSTLPALYVSDGVAWRTAEIYVSDGTAGRSVEVLYSKAGAWTVPTSL